jgi:hypothetical protein
MSEPFKINLCAEDVSLLADICNREMMRIQCELRAMRSLNYYALPYRMKKMTHVEIKENIDPWCSKEKRLRELRDLFDSCVPPLPEWNKETEVSVFQEVTE